ncbi:hypothetical protein NZD88_08060 [Chryseobacterium antibioticum]|uniref:Uncharacterized protein n=1 Tax=Chryseobacterium pyrolae TaxID=2987481 RepID=A0ABT2IFY0_9FLAO|nr:hypothetical protein [Chryseobacterium pyrolae]MCT2407489.1 hypothetical protein [Chryseobacterium pyrolae]
MKTKFTIKSLLPSILSIAFLFLVVLTLPTFFRDPYYEKNLFAIFFPFLFTFSFIVLFFGEVRTKCIILKINRNEIIIKRFWGLQTKSYQFSEIEGWKYSHLTSKGGTYQYLYLYKNGSKIAKISQFYHVNYYQIKNQIQAQFKYLGYEKFSYIDEFKETFR